MQRIFLCIAKTFKTSVVEPYQIAYHILQSTQITK
jgi:hypothetical protein